LEAVFVGFVNVGFEGVTEEILDASVKRGFAKTKAEALRLALLALNEKYGLLELEEDAEDALDAVRIDAEIASGKQKWLSATEFSRRTGVRFK
jgi:Arc/MetJ-type ribon-helix-helix transcriptional regulator